jgi:hypothetical protein
MKMAKASEADMSMAIEMAQALDALTNRWTPMMPEAIDQGGEEENERFDIDDETQCRRVVEYLLELADRASLFRVVFGMAVLLDPRNQCVDPDADTIEHHPDAKAGLAAKKARPLAEWHEDDGPALWWAFPIQEPPWSGQPTDDDWPHYHTHWTPLVLPNAPAAALETEAA